MNVIFGAGGVAREVCWLLSTIEVNNNPIIVIPNNSNRAKYKIEHFNIIDETTFFENYSTKILNVYIAVGSPEIKEIIYNLLLDSNFKFPKIVATSSSMDSRIGKVQIGKGSIIYPMSSLTTDIEIGDFVHINPNASIGHQTNIGDFTTICPGSNISGNVSIGKSCFIGVGSSIIDGVSITSHVTIGAGATVVKNIDTPGTYVGTPAIRIKDK